MTNDPHDEERKDAKDAKPQCDEDALIAIKASYADFLAGERGEPAREALAKACRELGLVIEE